MRVVVLPLVLCLVGASADAAAYCRGTTVKPASGEVCSTMGVPLKWFDRCADVKVLSRAKPGLTANEIADVVQTSFDSWNAATCEGEPVGLDAEVTIAQSQTNSPWESAVYFVDDPGQWRDRMNADNAVAVTLVSFGVESGRLRAADIEINDWNFRLGICDAGCASGVTDLENALTHEVGHFYGLGHMPPGGPETMAEWAVPGETNKRTLHRDDINGLCAIYPPGTFPEECTGSTFYTEEDEGCGCTTLGAHHATRSSRGWIVVVFALLAFGLRIRARA